MESGYDPAKPPEYCKMLKKMEASEHYGERATVAKLIYDMGVRLGDLRPLDQLKEPLSEKEVKILSKCKKILDG